MASNRRRPGLSQEEILSLALSQEESGSYGVSQAIANEEDEESLPRRCPFPPPRRSRELLERPELLESESESLESADKIYEMSELESSLSKGSAASNARSLAIINLFRDFEFEIL
ncbi:hypothetical protein PtA15_3A6 [Puccinia triticina]|uniref:Uncharacterized protein n=1 Tax=Puccinia triticina TaxID=208348 RepID=A0ABY7CBQ8_9BASI|nr:uncharacterized protein PtA15_3A6 [Puccinia triticina]WAQ82643.1 hypothetical protein PtA15_3A6 [Puccinia triticina]WAR53496.1 hypothetical protein PtB15_3B4 [Puccinia triticina]